jgi:surfeit locus 1 family protein
MNRLPVIPTILVLIAVATMIELGVWQLDRRHEKEILISRLASNRKPQFAADGLSRTRAGQ